jgi:hypothetical protein
MFDLNQNRTLAATFLATAVMLISPESIAADTPGTFLSPCGYQGNGGQYRWAVKIDPATPPATIPSNCQLSPLQMFNWTGGMGKITSNTPRQGREKQWIKLTGQVLAVIVEADGDVHLELVNAGDT